MKHLTLYLGDISNVDNASYVHRESLTPDEAAKFCRDIAEELEVTDISIATNCGNIIDRLPLGGEFTVINFVNGIFMEWSCQEKLNFTILMFLGARIGDALIFIGVWK